MFKKLFFAALAILLALQCRPVEKKKLTDINWDFNDPVLQKLYTAQDQQLTDSLLSYFNHEDPTYRYGAAMAFASYHDKSVIDSLGKLLKDEIINVRIAAAYALGQIGDEKAEPLLIEAFQDTLVDSDELRSAILEAVGKTGSDVSLKNLATVSTYLRADTSLLEGQTRALYRFALRGMTTPDGTSRMVDLIARRGYPESVRLIAANYLARAKDITLDSMATLSLSKALAQSTNENIRMSLALALGKTKSETALNALKNRFQIEKDYRVKCNILRAMGNFDYLAVEPLITPVLDDKNLNVASAAAQFFIDHGISRGANVYWRKAKDTSLHWQTQLQLYTASNRHLPAYFEVTKGQINRELKNRLTTVSNPYEKAAGFNALSEYLWNYKFIKDQSFDVSNVVVRTAGTDALANIAKSPDFERFFGPIGARRVKTELKDYFIEAVEKGDVAMTAIAAMTLREPDLGFKDLVDSLDFLEKAQGKLDLPKEMETWLEIQQTLDYFNDKEAGEPEKIAYNHPIDWEMVNGLANDVSATLSTNRGDVVIRFYPDLAPGSVINFIKLAKNGYYDDKNFHRVVSNFVAQGGCPRGDGWGGLDYSIRTELPPAYYDRQGLVGMARSGMHTECTQFFITHSPTPHLDGKYTIFAEVTEGMDVIHKIQQGDVIKKVVIQ